MASNTHFCRLRDCGAPSPPVTSQAVGQIKKVLVVVVVGCVCVCVWGGGGGGYSTTSYSAKVYNFVILKKSLCSISLGEQPEDPRSRWLISNQCPNR